MGYTREQVEAAVKAKGYVLIRGEAEDALDYAMKSPFISKNFILKKRSKRSKDNLKSS